jgi:hypothetical protein
MSELLQNVNINNKIGAKFDKIVSTNQALTAYVATPGTYYFEVLQALYPDRVFATLADAQASLPTATTTNLIPALIYVTPGTYTVSAKQVFATNRSGLEIYFEAGAIISCDTALSAGDGVIEIEGTDIKLSGYPTIITTVAAQTGSALIIGGSAAGEGTGNRAEINNLSVKGITAATDFAKPVVIRGASHVVFNNPAGRIIGGSTATTSIISVESGNSRNSLNLTLNDIKAKALTDSGNTCVPLVVAASQDFGSINGGSFTTDGTGKAATITAADWEIGKGAFFGSLGALTSGGVVDLISATRIRIGFAYYKKLDGATAPALIDQANV